METGTQSESGREPPAQSDIGIKATRVSETEGGASRIRGTESILKEELRLLGSIEELFRSIEVIHHTHIQVVRISTILRVDHTVRIAVLRHTINRIAVEERGMTRQIISQHGTHIGCEVCSTITHQQCRTGRQIDIPATGRIVTCHEVIEVELIIE